MATDTDPVTALVRESRAAQGLGPTVTDAATLEQLARELPAPTTSPADVNSAA